MSVKKCPKCGSVWYSALVNCAFCGVEGEEQVMNILTGKVHGERAAEMKAKAPPPPPAPAPEEVPVAVAEATPVPVTHADAPPPEVKIEPVPEVKGEDKPIEVPPAPTLEEAPTPRPEPLPSPKPVRPSVSLPPVPRIPSATVPVVFGVLGILAFLVIPAAIYLHYDRIGGVLTLLGYGVLAPFAPFAWLTGRRYEDRCRDLGFEPSWAGRAGRAVGTFATFMVVVQASLLALLAAILHLAGRLPNLFGA